MSPIVLRRDIKLAGLIHLEHTHKAGLHLQDIRVTIPVQIGHQQARFVALSAHDALFAQKLNITSLALAKKQALFAAVSPEKNQIQMPISIEVGEGQAHRALGQALLDLAGSFKGEGFGGQLDGTLAAPSHGSHRLIGVGHLDRVTRASLLYPEQHSLLTRLAIQPLQSLELHELHWTGCVNGPRKAYLPFLQATGSKKLFFARKSENNLPAIRIPMQLGCGHGLRCRRAGRLEATSVTFQQYIFVVLFIHAEDLHTDLAIRVRHVDDQGLLSGQPHGQRQPASMALVGTQAKLTNPVLAHIKRHKGLLFARVSGPHRAADRNPQRYFFGELTIGTLQSEVGTESTMLGKKQHVQIAVAVVVQ